MNRQTRETIKELQSMKELIDREIVKLRTDERIRGGSTDSVPFWYDTLSRRLVAILVKGENTLED